MGKARGIPRRFLWALVPLLAFWFACAAGRDWPFHPGPRSPRGAALLVASPDARTMLLRTELRVDAPGPPPPVQVSITHAGAMETSAVPTTAAGADGLVKAAVPLRLARGVSAIRFGPGTVASVRITQNVFNAGNLLFCLTLAAVITGSVLAARAVGAGGLHQFCAASLIGFLLVTASATLLSPFHLLTGGIWAGVLLAASLGLGVAAARRPAAAPWPDQALHPLEILVLLALVCPVFVMQTLSPVNRWDDLMYHGSRTGYWRQNASVLPFASHDDRLSVFPFGGDVLYACGTIISGSEMPGKFLVGLSYPLALFALLALLKTAGLGRFVALGVTVLLATTPIVISNAVGIKPDLWLVLLGIVTLHWVLTARRGDSGLSPTTLACLAAAGAGAAFGVKWTAAPLLLLAPFALLPPGWRQQPARRLLPPAVAFAAALALGGAGPILVSNLRASHHPFGPKAMRAWHQPDPGPGPLAVQFARLPFILFALPCLPTEAMRANVERWETHAADALGATRPLWKENEPGWPGRFAPRVRQLDDGFSLGWVFIAFGVVAGPFVFRRGGDREKRAAFLLMAGLSMVFGAAVVAQTRWQVVTGLPDRFLLPAYAFGLAAAAWPVNRLVAAGRKPAAVLLGAAVALHAVPYGALAMAPFRLGAANDWQAPVAAGIDAELEGISRALPPGRTILLFADQSCRDYPLFLAREGFPNRVLPWGKAAYDPASFERALHQEGVDTVILVSPETIDLIWEPPIDARPFVRDMDARADFVRVPGTGGFVVYLRKH